MGQIMIGVSQRDSGSTAGLDAIALGLLLARAVGHEAVITHVYRSSFDFPGAGHIDAEWRAFMAEQAQTVLQHVQRQASDEQMSGAGELTYATLGHKSSGVGLAEASEQQEVEGIVIGPHAGGDPGVVSTGATAHRLFHASAVPVSIAPEGYHLRAPQQLTRLVVAYDGTAEADRVLAHAVWVAEQSGCAMHLVHFITEVTNIYGSTIGFDSEAQVLQSLGEDSMRRLQSAAETCPPSVEVSTQICKAVSIEEAMAAVEWDAGDLLVTGSGSAGRLHRVFIGDTSFKILRNSRLPVMVVPRQTPAHGH